ncbi:hypothetical protein HUO09_10145 [Vibrio sp. Y2-5]|uniref:hypothetical protein n=1 Tax=Vibrio sp. Y2-5 TaxID=2743977 RepID=UPI001660CA86|nr:hypothetical protein [Vibrio sp. Y2-5]MBD0786709.1 hypothetical protein [Vibrio sp. Y2-5]
MKELFSSIYLEASNRMKSPILGTFVLCWLAYNHIWVAEFVLAANNAERLSHIKASSVSFWSDAFFPLLMASAYIFGVPFIQWGVDKAKYRLIEKRRLSTHHSQLSERYTSQARVSELRSKTTLEYWQEFHKNHAVNAGQQILRMKEINSSLAATIKERENTIKNLTENYSLLENTHHQIGEELRIERSNFNDLQIEHKKLRQHLYSMRDKLTQVSKLTSNLVINNDFYSNSKSSIVKSIELAKNSLKNGNIPVSALRRHLDDAYNDIHSLDEQRLNDKNKINDVLFTVSRLTEDTLAVMSVQLDSKNSNSNFLDVEREIKNIDIQ